MVDAGILSSGSDMFREGAVVAGPDGTALHLDDLSADELEGAISAQAAQISASQGRLAAMVAAARRRKVHDQSGLRSAGHWLGWRTGLVPGDAHRLVDLATALAERPATGEAFARGELSVGQAAAIARCPVEVEEQLVDDARELSATQLVRLCRTFRRIVDDPTGNDADYARWSKDPDGRITISARLSGTRGEAVVQALEAARRQIRDERESPCTDDPTAKPDPTVTNAEALERLADAALNSDWQGRSGADRTQVVVFAELTDLQTIGRSWIDGGGPLSLAERARMLCDASVITQINQNGVPLGQGRKTRTPNRAQRRAAGLRDQGCRFPGCGSTRFTELHHIWHWTDGGPTDLWNLITLCWRHHDLVHEKGWSMVGDANSEVTFRTPHGRKLPARPPTTTANGPPLESVNEALQLDIDETTARPGWGGEALTPYALDVLLHPLLPAAA